MGKLKGTMRIHVRSHAIARISTTQTMSLNDNKNTQTTHRDIKHTISYYNLFTAHAPPDHHHAKKTVIWALYLNNCTSHKIAHIAQLCVQPGYTVRVIRYHLLVINTQRLAGLAVTHESFYREGAILDQTYIVPH